MMTQPGEAYSTHSAFPGEKNPSSSLSAPTLSLPKGGGAVRGIGETFKANPVTGTGTLSIPIAVSSGRSPGPALSLTYDSGSGNSPFGLGWTLSLPAISRKTDRGLPLYRDDQESDVFTLSGVEDLVPVLAASGSRFEKQRVVAGETYLVHRYQPRIEGSFARIERWSRLRDGDVHWRSLSRDNILSVYGGNASARIHDPEDPTRIFTWLICESRDDKGNAIIYEYKAENSQGIESTLLHEANRLHNQRGVNKYPKRIRYGNNQPLLDKAGKRPFLLTATQTANTHWHFELLFDYGEHHPHIPTPTENHSWPCRPDPFSSYRAGFEIRTYRRCHRILMFHHFPEEPYVGLGCLVRSTDFTYTDPTPDTMPVYTFLHSVSQSGWRRDGSGYLRQQLPPVQFAYSQPAIQTAIQSLNHSSHEHLPVGLDNVQYQWTDLYGEGAPGILSQQGPGWFYKRNLAPLNGSFARFGPQEHVANIPNSPLNNHVRFLDLAGDGQPDLVQLDGPMPGFYEQDGREGWAPFRPFTSSPNIDLNDPHVRLIDLDGNGRSDILLTTDDALFWYPSLGEDGFGPGQRIAQALDETKGPRLIFADSERAIYLADMSGDGLTDLVRIRNGSICYWPNLGYGRFGPQIQMDNTPIFDHPDHFHHNRLRLADIDGSGTTDLIYLHRDGVRLYFNQSGNGWSRAHHLPAFPHVDDLTAVSVVDLLGSGTACLVWSSPLPGAAAAPLRYINLMGNQKPHLLINMRNNLGAETRIHYAPSTRFYLQDRLNGTPWATRLPFPVHVVERVETIDHISGNHFTSRYAYHHGYYDGDEREFRGFGMVEQWDTESFATLTAVSQSHPATNLNAASHVPPIHTKTWFHTGAYQQAPTLAQHYQQAYYRPPASGDDSVADDWLLPDSTLPAGLTPSEEKEAHRAMKGAMLRQEVYALDGSDQQPHPYTVTANNFTVRRVQPRGDNRHAIFFTHARETITCHYERRPTDPRIQHGLTLEVDDFGNVLRALAVGYGRLHPDPTLPTDADRQQQTKTRLTYTENRFTNAAITPHDYRLPLPCESRTFELTGCQPQQPNGRFTLTDWTTDNFAPLTAAETIPYEQTADPTRPQKRLLSHSRTCYRRDNLTTLLPLGVLESLALPGESYQLAFTPGILAAYRRDGQPLLPDTAVLATEGGYLASGTLKRAGLFPATDTDDHWWIPGGRVFLAPAAAPDEWDYARRHFFLPHRYRDPFQAETAMTYDRYDLLLYDTRDALGNRLTAGSRLPDDTPDPTISGLDYRVLQPWQVMDANRNRTQVAFDALGMVVATAVLGKPEETVGDTLANTLSSLNPDLTQAEIDAYLQNPLANPHTILGTATTRLLYDLHAFQRSGQPAAVCTLARTIHTADLAPGQQPHIQHTFTYSDGFGREIQTKMQAEPDPAAGPDAPPRWIGSGWTIFNNKGLPVRQYEPFFTALPLSDGHRFEFGVQVGVSAILCYDPAGRVVATLHPNHTWEKITFDPWQQTTWDVNDTVLISDPRTDPDVGDYFRRLPTAECLPTWHAQRQHGELGQQEQAAAAKAAAHANTPTTLHLDTLARPFLTIARNSHNEQHHTRVELDISGNQLAITDANQRLVMRYVYNMAGVRIHQQSMEAGPRWLLADITGSPIRAWNGRGHTFRTTYDPLRRPLHTFVTGIDPAQPQRELLVERRVYGETHPTATSLNLRGQLYLHLDQAGAASSEQFDFKGNLLTATRRLARSFRQSIDWSMVEAVLPADTAVPFQPFALIAALTPHLEDDAYTSHTRYDALNRPITLTTPDGSHIRPGYNEANLLEQMDVWLRGEMDGGQPLWVPFVTNIDYDANGQRTRIDYGSGTTTTYTYDARTFRLQRLHTQRPSPGDRHLQDLHYTYDPAGNITHIHDAAQQAIFFRNQHITPDNDYTYDALYRLIAASGREHLGQSDSAPLPHTPTDGSRMAQLHPGNGRLLAPYTERYLYDAVGNILQMQHRGSDPAQPGWTRRYTYTEASQIDPAQVSNRLSATATGSSPAPERYTYDPHGNITAMPQLGSGGSASLHWDYRDQLQQVDLGGGGTVWYTYNASGERVRKVWQKAPNLIEERIYLGGFEIYRRRQGNELLERETLHVMDGQQRIALVETRTVDTAVRDKAPARLIRYQHHNHLGSANLELDSESQIISYEEYSPYGSTTYQAVRSQTETPKRYRFTGKERDEETGLSYHGARYYAPWLARWISADPAGLADGLNLYGYGRNRPISLVDANGMQAAQVQLTPIETDEENANTYEVGQFGSGVYLRETTGYTEVWKEEGPQIVTFSDDTLSAKEAPPPPPPKPKPQEPETKPFDPYVGGVEIDKSWRTKGSNYIWEGTKEAFDAALDSNYSILERAAFFQAAQIGLAGSLLEQHVLNPFLNAPAQAFESGQLTARAVHRVSRGEYVEAYEDIGQAKDEFESAATSVATVLLPAAGGSKLKTAQTASSEAVGALTRAEKSMLRAEAREIIGGLGRKIRWWEDVHHRVPLEYSHLFEAGAGNPAFRGLLHPNRIENLRVTPRIQHIDVHRMWTMVRHGHLGQGTIPTAQQIREYEKIIAEQMRWRAMMK